MKRSPRLDPKSGKFYILLHGNRIGIPGSQLKTGSSFGSFIKKQSNTLITRFGEVIKLNWTSVYTRKLVRKARTLLKKMKKLKDKTEKELIMKRDMF